MTEQPPEGQGSGAQPPIPWEQPGTPFLGSLLGAIRLFIVSPTEAFKRMSLTADLVRPLLYACLVGWIGVAISQVYGLVLRSALLPLLSRDQVMPVFALPAALTVVAIVFAPVFVLIGLFIGSAVVHLFLMIVGGAGGGFATTLRVLSYSGTSQLAQLVPICGGVVGLFWSIVLQILGLAIAHRTTQGKAAIAVLTPILLCCACIGAAWVLFLGAIFASFGAHGK